MKGQNEIDDRHRGSKDGHRKSSGGRLVYFRNGDTATSSQAEAI
jgi:hypothetical protein